eukprot:jgi/Mesen1/7491/ME000039S06703
MDTEDMVSESPNMEQCSGTSGQMVKEAVNARHDEGHQSWCQKEQSHLGAKNLSDACQCELRDGRTVDEDENRHQKERSGNRSNQLHQIPRWPAVALVGALSFAAGLFIKGRSRNSHRSRNQLYNEETYF